MSYRTRFFAADGYNSIGFRLALDIELRPFELRFLTLCSSVFSATPLSEWNQGLGERNSMREEVADGCLHRVTWKGWRNELSHDRWISFNLKSNKG